MVRRCSILGCVSGTVRDREIRKSNNLRLASLYAVPKDAALLAKWSAALKMKLNKNQHICDFHFKPEDIHSHDFHTFPDGTYQIIEHTRWTLKPNVVPDNYRSRNYDQYDQRVYKISDDFPLPVLIQISQHKSLSAKPLVNSTTVSEHEPSQQVDSTNSADLDFEAVKSNQLCEHIYRDHPYSALPDEPITDLSNQNSEFSLRTLEKAVQTEQISESNMDLMTWKDLPKFIKIPPSWYYIRYTNDIMFVLYDNINLIEKVRLYLNEDMSVMIAVHNKEKEASDTKISCTADLLALLGKWEKTPICCGTGVKDESFSPTCTGIIANYKRRVPSPRCAPCYVARHRLMVALKRKRTNADIITNRVLKTRLNYFKSAYRRIQKRNETLRIMIRKVKQEYYRSTKDVDFKINTDINLLHESQQMFIADCTERAKSGANSIGGRYNLTYIYECLLIRLKNELLYNRLKSRNILPRKRSVEKFIKFIRTSAYGFQRKLFDCLKEKGENMSPCERRGMLVIDEIELSPDILFNTNAKDFIRIINLGASISRDLKDFTGDHALVLQFVPFKGKKSQVLGCFISKNVSTSQNLHKLIVECVILLENAGFHVDVINYDGALWNREIQTIFGIDDKRLSCPHPCDITKKLWMISDFSYLIKCFRTHLINNDSFLTPFGAVKKCHWQVVLDEDHYQEGNLKIAHKLTPAHLNPIGYQKMKVSLAYELFSDGVALAMKNIYNKSTYFNETIKDYEPTYNFIVLVNNLIKAMTAREEADSLYFQEFCKNRKAITDFLNFINDWEYGIEHLELPMPFSKNTFVGFRVTLGAALEIADMLHTECGFQNLLTSRLTQDYLEPLVSIMRYSCGSNEYSDPKLFLQVFDLLCCSSMVQPPKYSHVNGMEWLESYIKNNDVVVPSKQTEDEWLARFDEALRVQVFSKWGQNKEHDFNVLNINDKVIAYLISHLSLRLKRKYQFCLHCVKSLSSSRSKQKAQKKSTVDIFLYNNLPYPNKALFDLVFKLENIVIAILGDQDIEVDTMQKFLEKINQTQLNLVGCAQHSSRLTEDIIINYIVMRGHFLAIVLNKANEETIIDS